MATMAAAAVAVGCGGDDRSAGVACESYQFPAKRWKETNTRGKNQQELRIRRQAADAVVDCALLDGRSASEVRALLGRPHYRDPEGWVYVVGEERGSVVVDDEELQILFRGGRVTSALHGEG